MNLDGLSFMKRIYQVFCPSVYLINVLQREISFHCHGLGKKQI